MFRRKNVLRIPHGWIYYLAPEIVKNMSPELDEDQLPFSNAADVYAFGYWLILIWAKTPLIWTDMERKSIPGGLNCQTQFSWSDFCSFSAQSGMSCRSETGHSPTSLWKLKSGYWAAVRALRGSWQKPIWAKRSRWVCSRDLRRTWLWEHMLELGILIRSEGGEPR